MFNEHFDINETPELSKCLNDKDINEFIHILENLSPKDFPLEKSFGEVEKYLNDEEIKKLKLVKLLYCLDYNKELFLNLGIILESQLNNIVDLYLQNRWTIPATRQIHDPVAELNKFKNIKTLGEKGEQLTSLNLFDSVETSRFIKGKIESFSILRNFGGHHKICEFFNFVINDASLRDHEINECLYLIKYIYDATEQVKQNHTS